VTIKEFAYLVEEMRTMQKRFFRGEKSYEVVKEAKRLEKAVDDAIHDITAPTLFDGATPEEATG
jgi:hypothetical protein